MKLDIDNTDYTVDSNPPAWVLKAKRLLINLGFDIARVIPFSLGFALFLSAVLMRKAELKLKSLKTIDSDHKESGDTTGVSRDHSDDVLGTEPKEVSDPTDIKGKGDSDQLLTPEELDMLSTSPTHEEISELNVEVEDCSINPPEETTLDTVEGSPAKGQSHQTVEENSEEELKTTKATIGKSKLSAAINKVNEQSAKAYTRSEALANPAKPSKSTSTKA